MVGQLWGLGMSVDGRDLTGCGFGGEVGLWTDSNGLEIRAFSACFARSECTLGFERARIWGSADNGRDIGSDFGKNLLSDTEDLLRLWLNFAGIWGTSGAPDNSAR